MASNCTGRKQKALNRNIFLWVGTNNKNGLAGYLQLACVARCFGVTGRALQVLTHNVDIERLLLMALRAKPDQELPQRGLLPD